MNPYSKDPRTGALIAPTYQANWDQDRDPGKLALQALSSYMDSVGERNRAAINNNPSHNPMDPVYRSAELARYATQGLLDVTGVHDLADGFKEGSPSSIATGLALGALGLLPFLKGVVKAGKYSVELTEPFFTPGTMFDDALKEGLRLAKKFLPTAAGAAAIAIAPTEVDASGIKRMLEAFKDGVANPTHLIPRKLPGTDNLGKMGKVTRFAELEGWSPEVADEAKNWAIRDEDLNQILELARKTMDDAKKGPVNE